MAVRPRKPRREADTTGVTAVDTSVVVAALVSWHEHHEACRHAVEAALDATLVIPASALIESYSVLTRLPSPHRLRPDDAWRVLGGSFRDRARVVTLAGRDTWRLVAACEAAGVVGGHVYDARILAEARAGKATTLLTLNLRDFERLEADRVALVSPAARDGS